MPASNSVTLCGHLTRDPELRYLPNTTTAICQMGLAVTKRWKNKDGQNQEKAAFFDVKIWGTTAEEVADNLRKGDAAIVVGELEMETWTDRATNAQRSKVVIKADAVGKALYRKKDAPRATPPKREEQAEDPLSKLAKDDGVPF